MRLTRRLMVGVPNPDTSGLGSPSRSRAFCVLAVVVLAGCRPPAGEPTVRVSHRETPLAYGGFNMAISSGLGAGPDGKVYFATADPAGLAKLARFDPVSQRTELLADLGKFFAGDRTDGPRGQVGTSIVFDDSGAAWMGAVVTAPGKPAKVEGGSKPVAPGLETSSWLLRYAPSAGKLEAVGNVAAGSIADLAIDRKRGRLFLLIDGRLERYEIGSGQSKALGAPGAPAIMAMTAMPDGRVFAADKEGRLVRYDPAADRLDRLSLGFDLQHPEKTSTAPAGLPDQVTVMAAGAKGGKLYAITHVDSVLWEYDPSAGPEGAVKRLGPLFGPSAGPPPAYPSAKALCAAPDGRLYFGGFAANRGSIGRFDPRTGTFAVLGRMAVGEKVLPERSLAAACADAKGRVYFAGVNWGCGLYVMPPLPGDVTWSQSDRQYLCRRVKDGEIVIDGKLTDEAWKRVEPMRDFQTAGMTVLNPVPAAHATVARIAWSRTHLYLAFECSSSDGGAPKPDVSGLGTPFVASGKVRDDEVFSGECAELFLCPDGVDAPYLEIDFNPDGVLYDSRLMDYTFPEQYKFWKKWALGFSGDIRYAIGMLRDSNGKITGWTAEAAIAIASLQCKRPMPKAGDLWLFNLFRIAMPKNGQTEYSVWEPTHRDFHNPSEYPKLRFAD